MGEQTGIEWADHTFNPWIGCTKVSAACDNCYAERWGARFGVQWGNHDRRRTSVATWRQPLTWNHAAKAAGVRRRVFCASLADVFDNQVPDQWRWDLFDLIGQCPDLDWMLLTKRPQNIEKMLPGPLLPFYQNVWIGTTVENQGEADRRIPHLLRTVAARRFLSCEPLLSPLDLWLYLDPLRLFARHIDLVIVGGESGPGARPMHPDWARSLRDQCSAADVPFFFKQHGEWIDADEWLDLVERGPSRIAILGGKAERLWHPARPLNYSDASVLAHVSGDRPFEHQSDGATLIRVGKKAAGRLLDGREHNDMPPGHDGW